MLADLVAAFTLLTRLSVAGFDRVDRSPDLARCVWAFPIVGFAVNGMGGVVYWLGYRVGMSPPLAAAWALVATTILTGAFHEDGLADTADGFGGGGTPARKMEIMRDSRIGSYGALALLFSVVVRAAALAALDRPAIVTTAMIVAGMLGRSGIVLLLLILRPARRDGMAAAMAGPPIASAALGIGIAIVISCLLLPTHYVTASVVVGFALVLGLAKLASTQIGGHTGDVLGASEVLTECVVLTVIVCAFGR